MTLKKLRKSIVYYLFLLPFFVAFVIFFGFPVGNSIVLSFTKSRTAAIGAWVGLHNYWYILTNPFFLNALYNTLYMAILQTVLMVPAALILAVAINRSIAKTSLKVIYLLPYLCSVVATAIIWIYLYDPDRGSLNWGLRLFGFGGLGWVNDPTISKLSVVIYSVWRMVGYGIIIYLAVLQSIPKNFYEAAKLDGASSLQLFRFITLPLLKPGTIFLVIINVIQVMKKFQSVYMFGTETGNPNRSIQTLVAYIYEEGFGTLFFGIASAVVWVLFAIIFIITLINTKILVFTKE